MFVKCGHEEARLDIFRVRSDQTPQHEHSDGDEMQVPVRSMNPKHEQWPSGESLTQNHANQFLTKYKTNKNKNFVHSWVIEQCKEAMD